MVRFDTRCVERSGTSYPTDMCYKWWLREGQDEREVLVFGESESKNIPFLSFFLEKFHYVYNLP